MTGRPLASARVRIDPDFTIFKPKVDKGIEDGTKGSGEKAGSKQGNEFGNAFSKIAKSRLLTILGPALLSLGAAGTLGGVAAGAVAGIGLAFGTAAVAAGIYGTVTKQVLSQAATASKAVVKAQSDYNIAVAAGTKKASAYKAEQIAIGKAYAGMSPAQIQLSKQIGVLASQWQKLKESFTPLIASSLQPWLVGIREAMSNLGSVIKPMSAAVKDLGAQFAILMGSSTMQDFIKFIGTTGSATAHSIGGAILNVITAFITLLPQFTPLITGATNGITKWSVAFVQWASSQKAADQIHAFLQFFHDNGPAVRQFLVNIGAALKTLAPGLTAGGVSELNVMSSFFGLIAKLPPSLAKPLAEVAGALLVLNKLGFVSVGLRIAGLSTAETTAGAAAGAGLWSKILPGVRIVGGVGLFLIVVRLAGSLVPKNLNQQVATDLKQQPGVVVQINSLLHLSSAAAWIDQYFSHPARVFLLNSLPGIFAGAESWMLGFFARWGLAIAQQWNQTWDQSYGTVIRFGHNVESAFTDTRHHTAVIFDGMRGDIAHVWGVIWNNTIGRIQNGIADAVSWFHGMPGRITNAFGNAGRLLVGIGGNLITGLYAGIRNALGNVSVWVRANLYNPIVNTIKSLFGIRSPSTVMAGIGGHLISGLMKGLLQNNPNKVITKVFGGLPQALGALIRKGIVNVEQLPAKALSALEKLGGGIGSFFEHLFGGGASGGGGVERWRGVVDTALSLLGEPLSLANQVLYQIGTESGGNARAINLTDINAQMGDPSRGLLQVIGSTFKAYGAGFLSSNIYDPLANVYAAINYAEHVYGKGLMSGGSGLGSGHGYALGGLITEPIVGMGASGQRYTFGEAGIETVIPGDVGSKLDAMISLLAQLIGHTAAAPGATGAATAAALNGSARAGAYQAYYGVT